jgi:ribosomal protein L7Ae-like RNA K-turn-binding protein
MADATTRLFGMLGFAMRAGKVVIGTDIVCRTLPKARRIKIVLVSAGASESTKNKVIGKCGFYSVESRIIDLDTAELGRLLGKTYAPAVIGITDERFASEIRSALTESDGDTTPLKRRKEVSSSGDR